MKGVLLIHYLQSSQKMLIFLEFLFLNFFPFSINFLHSVITSEGDESNELGPVGVDLDCQFNKNWNQLWKQISGRFFKGIYRLHWVGWEEAPWMWAAPCHGLGWNQKEKGSWGAASFTLCFPTAAAMGPAVSCSYLSAMMDCVCQLWAKINPSPFKWILSPICHNSETC